MTDLKVDQQPHLPSSTEESCGGCGHPLSWHFKDVTGVARCTVIFSGVSDRGIIGIPWSERCACTDLNLPPPAFPKREQVVTEGLKKALREALAKARKVPDDDSTKQEI